MALRTVISKKHLLRLTAVGTIMIGFGFYCLYDGLVAYPAQLVRYEAYKELKENHELDQWPIVVAENKWPPFDSGEPARAFQELKEQGFEEDWPQMVMENNWTTYEPKERTKNDITMQFLMMGICWLIGLPVIINVLRCLGRWIEMDDQGLQSSQGVKVAFDQITKIDKKKWDKKGIAKLHYEVDGREKKFTLDDFIYERPTTDEILRLVEERVGTDKIVNGKPEPPPKTDAPPKPAEQPTG